MHSKEVHNSEATPCLLPEGEEVCMGSHCAVYGCAAGEHPWRKAGTLQNEQVFSHGTHIAECTDELHESWNTMHTLSAGSYVYSLSPMLQTHDGAGLILCS